MLRLRPNNFDLIRLFAAIQVMLLHSVNTLEVPVSRCLEVAFTTLKFFPGVPIFFFISGFLISKSYEHSANVKFYFVNRLLRIFPALWVCHGISLLIVYGTGYWSRYKLIWSEFIPWIFSEILCGHLFSSSLFIHYGIGKLNGSLWTIPVEMQFYFFIPVLYFFLMKRCRSASVILGLIIGLFFAQTLIFESIRCSNPSILPVKIIEKTPLPYLYMFLTGVFFNRNIKLIERLVYNKGLYWLFFYICLCLALKSLSVTTVWGNLPHIFIFLALAFTTTSVAYTLPSLSNRFLNGVDVSYGIYIYHMIFVNYIIELGFFGTFQGLVMVIVLTFLAAVLSWMLVEKEALRLKKYSIRFIDNHHSNTP